MGVLGLRRLAIESKTYRLPADPLVDDVLNPCFGAAHRVRGQFGYFTSSVLAQLSVGLSRYLAREDSPPPIQFVVSPWLSDADAAMVEAAAADPQKILEDVIAEGILREPGVLSCDAVEQHTLRCFAWLLARDLLEIDIAFVPGGLFHDKTWEFADEHYAFGGDGDAVFVTGSANATRQALRTNSEKMSVFPTWVAGSEGHVGPLEASFADTFEGRGPALWPISDALREQLIERWKSDVEPTEEDLAQAARRVGDIWLSATPLKPIHVPSSRTAADVPFIPPELNWRRPPYEHQAEGVAAWEHERRGVLEMATGAGKTWTSLIAATRAYHNRDIPMLLVIAVPFAPLLDQWADDCRMFGIEPILPTTSSGRGRKFEQLSDLVQDLTLGVRRFGTAIVTHNLAADAEFGRLIEDASELGVQTMLIGDEVHRLGSARFVSDPPTGFQLRLGLSATPERQYDPEGTAELYGYFGGVVYEFGLDRAIGTCLVEYDYFVEVVRLDHEELDEFLELTKAIGALWDENTPLSQNPALAAVIRKRRVLLDMAAGKLPALRHAIEKYGSSPMRHTLIYSTARESSQIDDVQELLHELAIPNERITYRETPDLGKVRAIIRRFRGGDTGVLNAMKVLDEGFNIPEITTAFILSSTGTHREWTQRRGRVLRRAPGKGYSTLVDFVVLPPPDLRRGEAVERYVQSELRRVRAFAEHARNRYTRGGGYETITQLLTEVGRGPGRT